MPQDIKVADRMCHVCLKIYKFMYTYPVIFSNPVIFMYTYPVIFSNLNSRGIVKSVYENIF